MFFGGLEILLLALVLLLVLGGTGLAVSGFTIAGFERQLDRWANDGVLTREAAGEVSRRYRLAWAQERRRRMVNALAILGAMVVGIGAILFFAANWDELPRLVRLVVLLVAMSACHAVGWSLRYRRSHRDVGHAFIFLGTFLFGVTLFLVDQMYHVEAADSWTFFWWTLAAVAVGLVVRSGPLAALAVLTLMTFVGLELEERADQFGSPTAGVALFALYGLALYGAGTAFRPWLEPLRFSLPLRMTGFALALGALFALSFEFAYEFFGEDARGPRGLVLTLLIVLAVASAASAAMLLLRRAGSTTPAQAGVLVCVTGLVLLATFVRDTVNVESFEEPSGVVWYAVVFSLVMAALALGALVAGFYADEVWLANAGLVFAVVQIAGRFFDPAWSMLSRSFVFLAAGALVLALAWALERRRPALQ